MPPGGHSRGRLVTPLRGRDGKSSTKGQLRREATAFANVVLPVPGGPNNTMAHGGSKPARDAISGWARGRTTRCSMSSFSLTIPLSESHRSERSSRPPS